MVTKAMAGRTKPDTSKANRPAKESSTNQAVIRFILEGCRKLVGVYGAFYDDVEQLCTRSAKSNFFLFNFSTLKNK
ncbi:hypothetical protein [Onishia taeanensis]|uniref:hypothetical protein n=1 Tax=Onishia taeanensis TaxID=284577 RepID=UPI0015EB86CE|nr:hypothetical protein [Halomonas taeanensis]